MPHDAQIAGATSPEDRLADLRAEYDALYSACMEDGEIDEEELQLLRRVSDKIDRAERTLGENPDIGFTPAGATHTTEATVADLGSEDTPLPPDTEDMTTPPVQRSISGAVGNGGRNVPADVSAVQQLLNDKGASLTVDGAIGPATVKAIAVFQQQALGFADGRVDPGGQTWEALAGGSAAPPPGGFEDDLTSLIDNLPPDDAPPPQVGNDPPPEAESPQGAWVAAETSVEIGFLTLKVATDDKGDVTGGALELQKKVDTPVVGVPPYYFGCGAALFGEVALKGPGPRVDVTFKIGGKGVGYLGVGPAVGGAVAGFKVEVELNGICDLPFDAIADLEVPANSEAFFGLPIQFSLGGAIKAGAEIKAGSFGISEMVPVAEYKDFLFLRIENGPDYVIAFGPGYHQFVSDIQNLHEQVIKAVEMAEENPEMAGTGGMSEELLVDKAKSAEDEINRVANEALIAALRQAEQQMQAAYQAGWENPSLVGKANALTQQDEDRAREIYGQAWTQRALAKQAYDQYGSPLDTAPADIIEARLNQAMGIAAQFNGAIVLFQDGDSQW